MTQMFESAINRLLPWIILGASLAVVALAAVAFCHWNWRMKFSRGPKVLEVSFGFKSQDLPLRSEQLGNVLHSLRQPFYKRLITGQPIIAFVYANIGRKTLFLIVPDVWGFADRVKDAILDKLTGSKVEEAKPDLLTIGIKRLFATVKPTRHSSFMLRSLKGFESDDPLEHLLNSMDACGKDNESFIFLMLKPVGEHWKRRAEAIQKYMRINDDPDPKRAERMTGCRVIFRSFLSELSSLAPAILDFLSYGDQSGQQAPSPNPYNPDRDHRTENSDEVKDIVKSIGAKVNSTSCFRYAIFIAVQGPSVRSHMVDAIGASFRQFDGHQVLTTRRVHWPKSRLLDWLLRKTLWPVFGRKAIMSSEELAGFIHNPYASTAVTKATYNLTRTLAPSHKLVVPGRGKTITIGYSDHRGVIEPVSVPLADFRLHAAFTGASGYGKSTSLKSVITQWCCLGSPGTPYGCLVLDPHGDLVAELAASMPGTCTDRLYFLEPSQLADPLALNLLAPHPAITFDQKRDLLIAAYEAIWRITPDMASFRVISQWTIDVLVRYPGAHIGYVRPFLSNEGFREIILTKVGDPEATRFWRDFGSKTKRFQEEYSRSFMSRTDQFIIDRRSRLMVAQSKMKLDPLAMMDEGQIVLCHFGDANVGAINKKLYGNLLCSQLHYVCRHRANERRPFLIVIDEAAEYLTPALAEMLAQDRKYGLTMMLAFQYLNQVEDILESIKGNVNTRVSFKLGESDAERMALFFSDSSDPDEVQRRADDLMNLSRFHGFLKTTVDGEAVPAATFKLYKPSEEFRQECIDIALSNTIRDFCRNTEEVADEWRELLRLLDESSIDGDDGGQVQF